MNRTCDFFSKMGELLTASNAASLLARSPSVFELLFYDQTSTLLADSLRHIILSYIEKTGNWLWAAGYLDEILASGSLLINLYGIMSRDATVLEQFYGIKRHAKTNPTLNSALLMAGSYAGTKLESYYQRNAKDVTSVRNSLLLLKQESARIHHARLSRLSIALKRLQLWCARGTLPLLHQYYPILRFIMVASDLNYRVLFAVGLCKYWNLSLHLLGIKYVRMEGESSRSRLESLFRNLISLAIVSLRFQSWWREEGRSMLRRRADDLPFPAGSVTKATAECPLCTREFESPTLVARTGYVYCYRCITEAVDSDEPICPASQISLRPFDSVVDLVRLYDKV